MLLHQTDTRDIIDLLSPKVLKKAKNDELLWDFYTSLHLDMQDSPFMPEPQIKNKQMHNSVYFDKLTKVISQN